jgi:probable rRNA maturation factor
VKGLQPTARVRFVHDISALQALVSVDEPFEGEISVEWLEDVTRVALGVAEVAGNVEVSVLITGDETVRGLNAEYRGLDENTDVLSFSAEHAGHWEGDEEGPDHQMTYDEFVLPPDIPEPLGEIIISWPQAQRQAVENSVSPHRELAHLVIHGALHLVGHDHAEPEGTERMQALERIALESLQPMEPSQA